MADQNLEIAIGVNNSNANNQLQETNAILKHILNSTLGIRNEMEKLGGVAPKGVKPLTDEVRKVKDETKAASEAAKQLRMEQQAQASVTNKAQIAMMNFGYTLQDASMFAVSFRGGLNAIGNNLPVMVQLLAQAKDEAKATGTSLKDGLVGALKGTGGVLIAVNLAVLAMQVLPGIFEKIQKSANKFKETLKEVGKAYSENLAKNLAEVGVFTKLSKVLTDVNVSLDDRKNALGLLQEKYPDYLKNIDLEKISINKLNEVIKDNIFMMKTKAEIMARESRLTDLYTKKFQAEDEAKVATPTDADYMKAYAKIYGSEYSGEGAAEVFLTAKADPKVQVYARRIAGDKIRQSLVEPLQKQIDSEASKLLSLMDKLPKGAYNKDSDSSGRGGKDKDPIDEAIGQLENEIKMYKALNKEFAVYTDFQKRIIELKAKTIKGSDQELKLMEMYTEALKDAEELQGKNLLSIERYSVSDLGNITPQPLSILDKLKDAQLSTYSGLASKRAFDPLSYDTGWSKFQVDLEKTINLTGSLQKGFDSAGEAFASALSKGLNIFPQVNSLLEIFIDNLVKATMQSITLALVQQALGFLGGQIPFLSFLKPALIPVGGAKGGSNAPVKSNYSQPIVIVPDTRIKGRDIYISYKRETTFRENRR